MKTAPFKYATFMIEYWFINKLNELRYQIVGITNLENKTTQAGRQPTRL